MEHLKHMGWAPYRVEPYVNGCGHGQEVMGHNWLSRRRMSQPPDDFMTADLAWISEWLLETATTMVERECEARGCSDWQLLQRRQEIASPRVQRALDILVASGFIAAPTDEDHERGGESG